MINKIKFEGQIELLSGMHIGGSGDFAPIGAIDSPVIKDPISNQPILPGSSLKGKMRTLLAASLNEKIAVNPNQDHEKIVRLFGASEGGGPKGDAPIPGRLIFRDAFLSNADVLFSRHITSLTEGKWENTIDRTTMVANPRDIERAIRGSQFKFELIYDMTDNTQVEEDLTTILQGMKLLELDYLGGSGSRGYGKIKFKDLKAETVFGDYDTAALNAALQVEGFTHD